MDPVEQDIKSHGMKETNYNRWYERNYPDALQRVREDYLFFEGVVMGYFPEIAENVNNLEMLHKLILNNRFPRQFFVELERKWLDDCEEEADRWLKEH